MGNVCQKIDTSIRGQCSQLTAFSKDDKANDRCVRLVRDGCGCANIPAEKNRCSPKAASMYCTVLNRMGKNVWKSSKFCNPDHPKFGQKNESYRPRNFRKK